MVTGASVGFGLGTLLLEPVGGLIAAVGAVTGMMAKDVDTQKDHQNIQNFYKVLEEMEEIIDQSDCIMKNCPSLRIGEQKMTRWNENYPCSEAEYNKLQDVDRVQVDVMMVLKGCELEPQSVINIMINIALSRKVKILFSIKEFDYHSLTSI